MSELNAFLQSEHLFHGTELVGYGDLTELPAETRENLPISICFAVKYQKAIT